MEPYHDDVSNFRLENMAMGCYKLTIEFNMCLFFQTSTQNKTVKLKCRGKKMIMGEYKYDLVTGD